MFILAIKILFLALISNHLLFFVQKISNSRDVFLIEAKSTDYQEPVAVDLTALISNTETDEQQTTADIKQSSIDSLYSISSSSCEAATNDPNKAEKCRKICVRRREEFETRIFAFMVLFTTSIIFAVGILTIKACVKRQTPKKSTHVPCQ